MDLKHCRHNFFGRLLSVQETTVAHAQFTGNDVKRSHYLEVKCKKYTLFRLKSLKINSCCAFIWERFFFFFFTRDAVDQLVRETSRVHYLELTRMWLCWRFSFPTKPSYTDIIALLCFFWLLRVSVHEHEQGDEAPARPAHQVRQSQS